MRYPMGYHITWGTHGARLHGANKPFVDRDHNQYGEPFPLPDPVREEQSRDKMKGDIVSLTLEQRELVEAALRDLGQRYEWTIHSLAAQSDHVHIVITAFRE